MNFRGCYCNYYISYLFVSLFFLLLIYSIKFNEAEIPPFERKTRYIKLNLAENTLCALRVYDLVLEKCG